MTPTRSPKPPGHLRPATARWWQDVATDFELDAHHLRLLTLAGESWDRAERAREALTTHGLIYVDRFGSPKARPEVGIARDSVIVFARLLRQLDLDVEAPDVEAPRLPALSGIRR